MTVPMTLLFTFVSMVLIGESANLISLGTIDFGIIVDSTLIMVENIYSHLSHSRDRGLTVPTHIMRAAEEVGRPIFFSTTIIVIAFLPLFTMTGVPGKIFSPMSITYVLALSGALLMAFTLAPALCSLLLSDSVQAQDTRIVKWLHRFYLTSLQWSLGHQRTVVSLAGCLLALAITLISFLGGEFMPALEEGNLWVRATMPVDISFQQADQIATDVRRIFRQFPEVASVVSQLGRPDDGTDPTSFFNAEFLVNLKPRSSWRAELHDKEALIEDIERILHTIPGVSFNFSQVIQDNVQEAMSGVKGENSVKLYGRDLKTLEEKAVDIEQVLNQVHGVKDLGIFRMMGQPNLLIQVDRQACARYGVSVVDVNTMVQAAVGGQAVTQVYEGEKLFDLVVRFLPEYRQDVESIGNILVSTPNGARIPLKQIAAITTQTGAFIIYRENNERYIPIKFSVRGRDLESTVKEAQNRITKNVVLPEQYRMEWHGEYDQLQDEKKRLAIIVPVSLLIVLLMVYLAVQSVKDAVLVLSAVPFALIGGVFSLFITGTDFSISAAVGFISLFGVAIQGALILIVRIRDLELEGHSLREAILKSAEARMRPVLMTSLAAAIGLLPAAVATGIGAQSQQPLARVVIGGMLTSAALILIVLPVVYDMIHRRNPRQDEGIHNT
jgi:cobalt-zinc-cadmium resistance protein CzcA